jgi:plastocyanin
MKNLGQVVLACILLILPTAALSATYEIIINDDGFQPSSIVINIGDTVRWMNKGSSFHSATSGTNGIPNGIFDSGLFSPGVTFERIFTLPGEVTYFDRLNVSKTGSISITADGVTISPGSSVLLNTQSFDLMFILNVRESGVQYSIFFDGAEVLKGSLLDLVANPLFRDVPTTTGADAIMLSIPPLTLPVGVHSLSIEAVTPSGQRFSDNVRYTVLRYARAVPAGSPQ